MANKSETQWNIVSITGMQNEMYSKSQQKFPSAYLGIQLGHQKNKIVVDNS